MLSTKTLSLELCRAFISLIDQNTGLALKEIDRDTLREKIFIRLQALQLTSPEDYYQLLKNSTPNSYREWQELAALITNNETYFFRDGRQLQILKNCIFPELIQRKRTSQSLRICSAGCSTGEEPYSLAILLKELIPDLNQWDLTILGIDINETALKKAARGIYSPWSFRGVNDTVKQRYFREIHKHYHLAPEIKQMVKFQPVNLIQDPFPQSHTELRNIDFFICRNVFIYFASSTIAKILDKIYWTLEPQGYFLAGHAELYQQDLSQFKKLIFEESVVYQRQGLTANQLLTKSPNKFNGLVQPVLLQEDKTSVKIHSLTDKSLPPHPPTPSPTRGEGEPEKLVDSQSPSPALGEGFRVRAKDFCQSTSKIQQDISTALSPKDLVDNKNKVNLPKQSFTISSNSPAGCGRRGTDNKNLQQAEEKILEDIEALCQQKDYEQANKLLLKHPNNLKAHQLIAEIYANLGSYEKAIHYCYQALEINSFFVNSYYLLAQIAEEQGRLVEAKRILKKIIFLEPNYWIAYLDLSHLYQREGDYARALKMQQTALNFLKQLPPNLAIKEKGGLTAAELILKIGNITS